MDTNASTPGSGEDLDAIWRAREDAWRRKLGRLRLGAEPIEEQLARYRRMTWGGTAIVAFPAAMFFTLFAVFGRPGIGLVFDAVVLLPIVLIAWADYALMSFRARQYLAEKERSASLRE
jgi:hypothetical protein